MHSGIIDAQRTDRAADGLDEAVTGLTGAFLERREELLTVLTHVATRQAAEDEFLRSLRALAGAPWEIRRNSPERLRRLATFLPSNNLLYSYVLFGIIPSLYTDTTVIRPSGRVARSAMAVHEILGPAVQALGTRIAMAPVSQRTFLAECAASDAVVFTGQPENAGAVAARLPRDVLFLAFGSGPNPVVIGPEADLDMACRAVLAARLYNSGQDCLCTDIVFVHRSVAAEVVMRLADALASVRIGDRCLASTQVAPLVYPDAVQGAAAFLATHRKSVVRGGRVDVDRATVEPSLLHMPWRDGFHPPEFFSPVVLTMEYEHAGRIRQWLHSPMETSRGMYVSVFGEPGLAQARVSTSSIAPDRVTFDVEDGNRPFGGFGPLAGSVRRRGIVAGRPLLLSAEAGRGERP